jgi:hypothetical protein
MRPSRSFVFVIGALTVTAPIAVALSAPATASPHPAVAAAKPHTAARGDFDGDGKSDIVVGAPGGNRVKVVYTKAKPGGSHSQWLMEPGGANGGFGLALAVGDFNGDGFTDLAVGAPGFTNTNDDVEEGAVFIFDGSKTGLTYSGTMFHGPDDFDNDNEMGTSLSAGPVNADRFADLAIGNPGPAGGADSEGSVQLLFGSATGLSFTGAVGIVSAHPVDEGDFGQSVVLADVNGDGHRDVVVGEPGGGPGGLTGDIQVFYATAKGLGTTHRTILGSTLGVGHGLGSVLAAGTINKDRFADVVAGAPDATVHGRSLAGKVVVLYGGKHGLSAAHDRVLSEATPHIPGAVVSTDRFGHSVAVGNVTASARGDVIIGAIGAVAAGEPAGGVVYVLRGGASGVVTAGCQRISQATKGVPGNPVSGSQFGSAVATIGTATAAHRDLLVGMPDKHKGGEVFKLRGGPAGVSGQHARVIRDAAVGDEFGSVLAL